MSFSKIGVVAKGSGRGCRRRSHGEVRYGMMSSGKIVGEEKMKYYRLRCTTSWSNSKGEDAGRNEVPLGRDE